MEFARFESLPMYFDRDKAMRHPLECTPKNDLRLDLGHFLVFYTISSCPVKTMFLPNGSMFLLPRLLRRRTSVLFVNFRPSRFLSHVHHVLVGALSRGRLFARLAETEEVARCGQEMGLAHFFIFIRDSRKDSSPSSFSQQKLRK